MHPNLRDNGQAAPKPSHRTRQKATEPGASAISLSSSLSQSKANRLTPAAWAAAIADAFLTVLPKLNRSDVAPAARHCSISPSDATSKEEPSSTRRRSTAGNGFAFTA